MKRFLHISTLAFILAFAFILFIPEDALAIVLPVSGVDFSISVLLILGFGVGVMGGFYGLGGAWLITPGLNIFGFPMAFAIGTDMAHIAGKSIVSTFRHARFGNVDWGLGIAMLVGTMAGIEIAARFVMYLERIGFVGGVVRWTYVGILAIISATVFYDVLKKRRLEKRGEIKKAEAAIKWAATLQRIHIPPMFTFKQAGIRCSLWLPVIVGFITGIAAGFLGIGGGLLRMPALIYLFEVLISGAYGAFTYTAKGRCELLAAVIMLMGAAVGAQIGTVATKYVRGYFIRVVFGVGTTCALISIILKQLKMATPAGILIIMAIICITSLILILMLRGAFKEVREKKAAERAAGGG
jgi:uncharacterized membrane protein YfcA